MSKESKGSTNMLLLAGLGVGAFLLFSGKASAGGSAAPTGTDAASSNGSDDDIPEAPKILAVNKSSTESPTPTAIVSDEDGMEATASSAGEDDSAEGDTDSGDDSDSITSAYKGGNSRTTAAVVKRAKDSGIPSIVSTKLTPKEQAIIDKGALTDELAIQRPDLYKAIYIKKHGKGGKGATALKAANERITRIHARKSHATAGAKQKAKRKVAISLSPATAGMVAAAAAQAAGGGAALPALTAATAALTAYQRKEATQKAASRSHKGAHPHSAVVHRHPAAAHHPAAKHPATRHPAAHHRPSPLKK